MNANASTRGIYIHMPWCVSKCPYCDFNSHAVKGPIPEEQYVNALLADLDRDTQNWGAAPVATVFVGGGTPSLMEPETIARVLAAVRRRQPIADGAEITLEANPESLTEARAAAFAEAGVNRFSIGVQSMDNRQLVQLGRAHDAAAAKRAIRATQAAGVDNINVDLMYGLPGQSAAEAEADVRAILELDVAHLSHYQLTLEPNTVFHARPPANIPDDDAVAEIEGRCRKRMLSAGLAHYEISAFAQPGRECAHNLNYWRFGDYLGLGAGAHGKLRHGDAQYRTRKPSSPRAYMACQGAGESARISEDALAFEFLLNRLRLLEPVSEATLAEAVGTGFGPAKARLEELADERLMVHGESGWQPTRRGRAFLNDVLQRFLPPTPT